ncbi:hypothetical protein Bca52824_040954 [Brassica carinata]|uniref:APO domain-containing protein n=1 Tax=Brassica carinata TaxID=52824 RepID=A0A8X7UVZ8_BRACI|nr:hypothetical protein Bca52824_040954 [Brassica carinata]
MIQRRIENRAKDYPIQEIVPLAKEVLKARRSLLTNVTLLLKVFPVLTCNIYRQEEHLIQTCCSYIRLGNNKLHERVPGSTYNVLVPVGSSTYTMSQGVIRHQHWFDSHRVPSILELCCQAGAIHPVEIHDNLQISDEDDRNFKYVGTNALMAWEKVRAGLKTLLLVYPSKVCNRRVNEGINYYGHASTVASL